jgi:N-acetylmuramoyl-L-alanine amidase
MVSESDLQEDISTVQTVSLPVSGKTIVVDAGHGVPDEGAQSSDGTTEAETNLKIALKLQNLLEQSGCTVILTRSDENAIYDIDSKTLKQKKVSDIHNRVKIGNESQADIFVSIHLNKIPQAQYDGWQTFYNKDSEDGQKLATAIQSSLNEAIQKENNRVAKTIENIYIINHVEIPTTIVECGFLSNPDEEKKLLDDEYQNRLAWGIYNGIIEYFYE